MSLIEEVGLKDFDEVLDAEFGHGRLEIKLI